MFKLYASRLFVDALFQSQPTFWTNMAFFILFEKTLWNHRGRNQILQTWQNLEQISSYFFHLLHHWKSFTQNLGDIEDFT